MQRVRNFFEVGSLGHDISFCRESSGGPPAAWRGQYKKFPEPRTARFNARGNYRKDVALTSLHTDKTKFARWGDGYSYHIGDLSACVLPGHDESKKTVKYQSWAECLFVTGTQLRHPVYFWAAAWKSDEAGVWDEYGPTSLAFLEYLLIGIAGGLSDCLLNREGIARAKGIQR